jgi:hypothetical protein
MARTPLPPNGEYVRRLAEVLAVLRHALELVEDTRAMPLRGFGRMHRLAYPRRRRAGRLEFRDPEEVSLDAIDVFQALRGVGWAIMTATSMIECRTPPAVEDLADRITVELAVDEDNPANPNEAHAAAGAG